LQIFSRYVEYLSTYLQNICIKVADICRYVNCLSTYLQNICIKVADICRYVNCLSKYLQNICKKIADILQICWLAVNISAKYLHKSCRYVNCLSTYLQNICIKVADMWIVCQNICIKIADICRYANCLSIYSILNYTAKNILIEKTILTSGKYLLKLIFLIRETILKMRSIWFARHFFLK
jgi:hypothetical protein